MTRRPVLMLLAGGIVAQLIQLAASPLLTRLFEPQAFGSFALFASLAGLFAVIATGRYDLAILSPRDDDESFAVLVLACSLALVLSLAGGIVLVAGNLLVPADVGGDLLPRGLLLLLPLSTLATAWLGALLVWANRQRQYARIAENRVIQSTAFGLGGVALGARQGLGSSGPGLVIASLLSQWLAVLLLLVRVVAEDRRRFAALRRDVVLQQARRFAAFPRLNLPHAVLDNLQGTIVLALLGIAFGAATLGLYAFMQRIMRSPIALLGSSIGQVFQEEVATAIHAERPVRPMVVSRLRSLAIWTVPFVLLAPFAPWAFAFAFGEQWREAGVYGLILTPWIVANFLVSPLSQLPLLLGRLRGALWFGLAYQAALVTPCVVAVVFRISARDTFVLQSLASCVVLAMYGRWLLSIAGHADIRGGARA